MVAPDAGLARLRGVQFVQDVLVVEDVLDVLVGSGAPDADEVPVVVVPPDLDAVLEDGSQGVPRIPLRLPSGEGPSGRSGPLFSEATTTCWPLRRWWTNVYDALGKDRRRRTCRSRFLMSKSDGRRQSYPTGPTCACQPALNVATRGRRGVSGRSRSAHLLRELRVRTDRLFEGDRGLTPSEGALDRSIRHFDTARPRSRQFRRSRPNTYRP